MADLVIPEKVFDQHIIMLGKTRSGKSSAMRYLAEHLLDEHKPLCIVDPKGDWWGIKSSASGKSSGYAVTIFGGEHGDLPLNAGSGSVVAELAATENRPCLVDLGGWMPGDRTRFWIDFASSFFRMTRGRRWLLVDEVHNFCPKGKIMDVNAGKMLHWSNRLASEGLGKGVALIAASQRPQKVHNDFLTSCETLIAMRVIHKADRDALKDWIDACGDAAKGKEVLATVASRKRGEAWAYSPEIEFGPQVVQFPMFKTYDSFKPRDAEHPAKLKGWAEVDLEKIKHRLETVVKEAEANDPAKLKLRIVDLEKQLRSKGHLSKDTRQSHTPSPDIQRKNIERAVTAATREWQQRLSDVVRSHTSLVRGLAKIAKDAAALAEIPAPKIDLPALPIHAHRGIATPVGRVQGPPERPGASSGSRSNPPAENNGHVSKPQAEILKVLAEMEALGRNEVAKATIAAMAGVSYTSSAYGNNLGALRTAGMIDYPAPGAAKCADWLFI